MSRREPAARDITRRVDLAFYQSFPILATRRLRLRELTADGAPLLEMFRDPEVTRCLRHRRDDRARTGPVAHGAVAAPVSRPHGIRSAIESITDGRLLGTGGYPVIVASNMPSIKNWNPLTISQSVTTCSSSSLNNI